MLTEIDNKPTNEHLEGLSIVYVDSSGSILGDVPEGLFLINGSKVVSEDAVNKFLATYVQYVDRFASFTIAGSKISGDLLISFLKPIVCGAHLVELNLSYLTLSNAAIDYLCTAMNKVTGHNNQVKRLIVTRCDIGLYNLQKIIYALCENITLQELIITCNNRCNDELFIALKKYILFSRNNVRVLGLGGNQITSKGVMELSDILSEASTKLTEIQLNNNDISDIDASGTLSPSMDRLILSIHSTNTVETLNLSNCNLSCFSWTRYLPYMYTLSTLILAHNHIDDNELVKIGANLENCVCLRHLDLSYNKFGGVKCCLLQRFLESNQYLFSLSLRGNTLEHAVWKAFGVGLMTNPTLQVMDVCNCSLTIEDAMVMCFAFTANEVVVIDMNNNNLPNELMDDPRRYCIDKYRTAATPMPIMEGGVVNRSVTAARSGGNNNRAYLPRSAHAVADSIPLSKLWRAERIDAVKQSVEAFEAAAHRQTSTTNNNYSITSGALVPMVDGSQSLMIYDHPQLSTDVVMMGDSHSQILFPVVPSVQQQHQQNKSLGGDNNPENVVYESNTAKVEQVGKLVDKAFFVSVDKLQGLIDEADMANTMEPQTVSISYGNISANMLGTMTLTGFTTYYEAFAFIKPLVSEHLSHLLEETRVKLVNGFTLFDPKGTAVPQREMKLRKIWPEMCTEVAWIKSQHSKDDNIDAEVAAAMTIVVRPANWITLPDE